MKLFSYAQIQKETPFLHLGYTSAPPPPDYSMPQYLSVFMFGFLLGALLIRKTSYRIFCGLAVLLLIVLYRETYSQVEKKYQDSIKQLEDFERNIHKTGLILQTIGRKIIEYEEKQGVRLQNILELEDSENMILKDSWGNAIICNLDDGYLLSTGADGKPGSDSDKLSQQDNVICVFRVYNSIENAQFLDIDANEKISAGDRIVIRFEKTFLPIDISPEALDNVRKEIDFSYSQNFESDESSIIGRFYDWRILSKNEIEDNGIKKEQIVLQFSNKNFFPEGKIDFSKMMYMKFSWAEKFWDLHYFQRYSVAENIVVLQYGTDSQ